MELRHLQSFATAAELRNFTRTGEMLGLTQAAVSQHVSALEKELRVSLFDRSGRAVELTEAGRTLYDYARRVLDLCDEAREKITHEQTVVRGTLRVAASTVPAEWLLPQLLIRFRDSHPEVCQSVAVTDSMSAIRAVESGQVEVGLVGEQPRAGNLSAQAIARDELSLVVAPTHPFASAGAITLDELTAVPLIMREPGSGSRRCVEESLKGVGVSICDLTVVMEVSSNEAIRAAVEGHVGSSFLSIRAIRRDIDDGRLVPISIQGIQPARALYLITNPQQVPTRAAREFFALLRTWPAVNGFSEASDDL